MLIDATYWKFRELEILIGKKNIVVALMNSEKK
jgi:hypothetical protein